MIGPWRDPRPWREGSYAVLDFETTGLDPVRDDVLSFGVVPVERGRIRLDGALYRVVRPPVAVPAESIRVHGIRPDELRGAPLFDEIAHELHAALEKRMLVAHAAQIELVFLEKLRRKHGGRRFRNAIDVLHLAAELAARAPDRHAVQTARLADLAQQYGVPVARTHHAFGDALTTAQLFLVLATLFEGFGRGGLRDLTRVGRSQIARSARVRPLERTRLMA